MKTPFDKGQKLEKLYPAFNAFETFIYLSQIILQKLGTYKRWN